MFMGLPVLLCVPQVWTSLIRDNAADFRFHRRIVVGAGWALLLLGVCGFYLHAPSAIIEGSKTFLSGMAQEPSATVLAGYVDKLRIIRDDPEGRNAAVYIPRTETAYWESMYVRSVGYFIPAISEHPALYAWPTKESYSFLCGPRYHSNGLCEKSQGKFTDSQLIAEAKKLGFDRVYIVTSKGIRDL